MEGEGAEGANGLVRWRWVRLAQARETGKEGRTERRSAGAVPFELEAVSDDPSVHFLQDRVARGERARVRATGVEGGEDGDFKDVGGDVGRRGEAEDCALREEA